MRRYDLAKAFAVALIEARAEHHMRFTPEGGTSGELVLDRTAVAREAVAHADALIEELGKIESGNARSYEAGVFDGNEKLRSHLREVLPEIEGLK